jgi:hypothetical protein
MGLGRRKLEGGVRGGHGGNLYHLNAEEEPENMDYPKNPEVAKCFGPRGVIHSYADGMVEHDMRVGRLHGAENGGHFLQTFKEFPPRQKAASFTVDQAMEKLKPPAP